MVKILILVLSALIILLCLLQEDKSNGILSLGVKAKNNSKDSKAKYEKHLNIITAVSVLALFICLFVEML